MDFSNEEYVRLYVRDTLTWKRLGWDGQNVFAQLLRKFDRAGVIDLDGMEPWEAATLLCGAPEASARAGMQACLERGVLSHNGDSLVCPNYRDAQECSKTDKQRQKESRTRRRETALRGDVTKRDNMSQNVTEVNASGSDASRSVTDGHDVSPVALRCDAVTSDTVALPSRAMPFLPLFGMSEVEEIFGRLRVEAGGGRYKRSMREYSQTEVVVEFLRDEPDPFAACERSIAAFLEDSWAASKGWPFGAWANDVGKWLAPPPEQEPTQETSEDRHLAALEAKRQRDTAETETKSRQHDEEAVAPPADFMAAMKKFDANTKPPTERKGNDNGK